MRAKPAGRFRLAVVALLAFHALPLLAASDSTNVAEVRVVKTTAPISIDGNLSEPAWQEAPAIGGFKQRDPNEGADASQPTEVRLLFDDDALYVGARMHDAHADSIVRWLTRRDGMSRKARATW